MTARATISGYQAPPQAPYRRRPARRGRRHFLPFSFIFRSRVSPPFLYVFVWFICHFSSITVEEENKEESCNWQWPPVSSCIRDMLLCLNIFYSGKYTGCDKERELIECRSRRQPDRRGARRVSGRSFRQIIAGDSHPAAGNAAKDGHFNGGEEISSSHVGGGGGEGIMTPLSLFLSYFLSLFLSLSIYLPLSLPLSLLSVW